MLQYLSIFKSYSYEVMTLNENVIDDNYLSLEQFSDWATYVTATVILDHVNAPFKKLTNE